MRRRIILFCWLLAFFCAAASASAREIGGLEIPEILETPAGILVLNGVGERHIFAESVYVAGLYLRQAEKNWREVVEKKEPMAIRLQITQAFFASSTRMRDAIDKGFQNNRASADKSPTREKAQAFMDCFAGEIHTGDVFVIRYIPGRGTGVLKNDEFQARITGHEFKEAVFSIWLGDAPAQASLKEGLLAADVTEEALALRKAKQITAEEKQPKKPAAAPKKTAAIEAEAPGEIEKGQAPGKSGPVEKAAAAESAGEEKSRKRVFSENIYFPLGKDRLTEKARRKLDAKVTWLKAHSDTKILIAGHSDSRGPAAVNFELAKKRAEQVKAYLAAAGIAKNRMFVRSYGERRPAAAGNTPAALAKNRRVEFTLIE